jgi:carnitine-CoA ligase
MTIRSPAVLPAGHPFAGMDVTSALAERVQRYGAKPFLIWEPGGEGITGTWTYATFAREVGEVAAGLAARGVGRGDAVMLLLENAPAFLLCWFACARLGAVAIDTNTRYAGDELAHVLSRTAAIGIITHPHLKDVVASVADDRWLVLIDDATGTCPTLRADPTTLPAAPAPDPAAALCVQFTSGTTSRPKAVLYTHANALWAGRVGAVHGHFDSSDVALVYAPLFHTMALSWQVLSTFWVGGTIVLLPRFTASRFWPISLEHRCTTTTLLGIIITTLLDQETPSHHYRGWHFGLEMPELESIFRVRFINCWGMSEVVTNVIVGERGVPAVPGTIGRSTPEYPVRVVRPDGSDTEVGEAGELRVGGVRGLSLFAGYHGDEQATADAFDEQGYFRTGDCVELTAGGAFRFVTRLKDMLKVGGENVAAAEVERVLTEHPNVSAAAVVGRRDRVLDEVPVAFVVLHATPDDPDRLSDQIIEHCRAQLADFKVPRAVHILDELPEATLGKIAKGTLRELAEAQVRQSR